MTCREERSCDVSGGECDPSPLPLTCDMSRSLVMSSSIPGCVNAIKLFSPFLPVCRDAEPSCKTRAGRWGCPPLNKSGSVPAQV